MEKEIKSLEEGINLIINAQGVDTNKVSGATGSFTAPFRIYPSMLKNSGWAERLVAR